MTTYALRDPAAAPLAPSCLNRLADHDNETAVAVLDSFTEHITSLAVTTPTKTAR